MFIKKRNFENIIQDTKNNRVICNNSSCKFNRYFCDDLGNVLTTCAKTCFIDNSNQCMDFEKIVKCPEKMLPIQNKEAIKNEPEELRLILFEVIEQQNKIIDYLHDKE